MREVAIERRREVRNCRRWLLQKIGNWDYEEEEGAQLGFRPCDENWVLGTDGWMWYRLIPSRESHVSRIWGNVQTYRGCYVRNRHLLDTTRMFTIFRSRITVLIPEWVTVPDFLLDNLHLIRVSLNSLCIGGQGETSTLEKRMNWKISIFGKNGF
jgi:hypothetical protein